MVQGTLKCWININPRSLNNPIPEIMPYTLKKEVQKPGLKFLEYQRILANWEQPVKLGAYWKY